MRRRPMRAGGTQRLLGPGARARCGRSAPRHQARQHLPVPRREARQGPRLRGRVADVVTQRDADARHVRDVRVHRASASSWSRSRRGPPRLRRRSCRGSRRRSTRGSRRQSTAIPSCGSSRRATWRTPSRQHTGRARRGSADRLMARSYSRRCTGGGADRSDDVISHDMPQSSSPVPWPASGRVRESGAPASIARASLPSPEPSSSTA